jgi:hypothetical protein
MGSQYKLNRYRNNCIFEIDEYEMAIIDAATHRIRKVQVRYVTGICHTSTEYHPNGQIRYHLYLKYNTLRTKVIDFCYFRHDDVGTLLSYRDFEGNEWKIEWGIDFPFGHHLSQYYRLKKSTIDLIEVKLRKYRMFMAFTPSEVIYASKIIDTIFNVEKNQTFNL